MERNYQKELMLAANELAEALETKRAFQAMYDDKVVEVERLKDEIQRLKHEKATVQVAD